MSVDVREMAQRLAGASPFEVLRTALELHGDRLRLASSFGAEDMIVLHEAVRAGASLGIVPRVFLLDTGRLHAETLALVRRTEARYGVHVEAFTPDVIAVERLVRRDGPDGFYASVEARKACCAVRKLEPLARALDGAEAWVTGLRRAQSPTRATTCVVAYDDEGRVKWSPLAAFEDCDVWAFVAREGIDVHPLHAQGYPSIGCAPCTRPIEPGEDVRAGRWWWEAPEHKECGLHAERRS